jgi:hypothetical protein
MNDLLLFKNDEKTFMDKTTWLRSQHMDVPMNISYETNLQHQGYESHQYQYIMELKDFLKNQYFHMSMNHKIFALLDSRNINMPCVLYDLKIPHDKMFCENTN